MPLIRLIVAVVAASMFGCNLPAAHDVNVARASKYVVDPPPNYVSPVSVPEGVLTDGAFGARAHWVTGQSLGWQSVSPVTVELNLGAEAALTEIRVHVSQSTPAGLQWPSGAYLFLSSDGERFQSIPVDGELVVNSQDGDRFEKGYLKFALNGVRTRKFVVAVFSSPLLFIDEIEAFGRAKAGADKEGGTEGGLTRGQLGPAIRDARIAQSVHQASETLVVEHRLPTAVAQQQPPPWLFRRPVTDGRPPSCTADRIWPWQSFRLGGGEPQALPSSWIKGDPALVDEPAYLAWQIVNHDTKPRALRHKQSGTVVDALTTSTFVLGYLPTPSPAIVGDVLLPLPPDLVIPPGESVTLLLKAVARDAGVIPVSETYDCGDDPLVLAGNLLTMSVPNDIGTSNLTTWAYPMELMKGALQCKPGFQREYGIDTDAIHPNALGDLSQPAVANLLVEQLSLSRGAKRALLFMNILDHPVFKDSLDARALGEAASRWLSQLANAIERSGFKGEVLLYPVDEFSPDTLRWFRRLKAELGSRSSYRFYGTIGDPAVMEVASDLDVASINFSGQIPDKPELRRHEFYVGEGPAKELSPSRFYYLMPIRAAVRKAPGFGIWALYDSSGAGAFAQGWSDIGVGERDYGMLYFDRNQCPIPSLRLAALGAGRTAQKIVTSCWGERAAVDSLAPLGTVAGSVGDDMDAAYLNALGAELSRCAASALLPAPKANASAYPPAPAAKHRTSD